MTKMEKVIDDIMNKQRAEENELWNDITFIEKRIRQQDKYLLDLKRRLEICEIAKVRYLTARRRCYSNITKLSK